MRESAGRKYRRRTGCIFTVRGCVRSEFPETPSLEANSTARAGGMATATSQVVYFLAIHASKDRLLGLATLVLTGRHFTQAGRDRFSREDLKLSDHWVALRWIIAKESMLFLCTVYDRDPKLRYVE
jgi:hypothetical protein